MGNLGEHQRAIHEGVKYPCGQCGKKISQKGHLTEHQRGVHEGVKYPCGQCGKQFSQKGHRAEHQRSVHEGVKDPCRQCGKQLSQGYLAQHQRQVPCDGKGGTGEMNFYCNFQLSDAYTL